MIIKIGDQVKLSKAGLDWLYSPRSKRNREQAMLRRFIVVGFGREGSAFIRVTPIGKSPFTQYTYASQFLELVM